jgi:hypothetical protein
VKLREILKIFVNWKAWSFVGVLLTIALFGWDRYRNSPDLEIIVQDEINLIEIRERIESLEIRYQGKDLLDSKKEIKIITVSILNEGQTILQQYYDQMHPFGLRVADSIILRIEVVDSNSEYLRDNILLALDKDGKTNQSTIDSTPKDIGTFNEAGGQPLT